MIGATMSQVPARGKSAKQNVGEQAIRPSVTPIDTLLKVWEVVSAEEEDNAYWSSFDSFDDFMCSWLV